VIEVADTSLEFDTTVKAGLYAAAGIADYWVVDLVSRAVIVLREPRGNGYESRSTHRGDQLVRPLARAEATLSPAELFLPDDGARPPPPRFHGPLAGRGVPRAGRLAGMSEERTEPSASSARG